MSLNDKSVKIPYPILKRLVNLLEGIEEQELMDLYIYMYGKAVQVELREKYDPNNAELKILYNKNKNKVDELEERLKNSILTTTM